MQCLVLKKLNEFWNFLNNFLHSISLVLPLVVTIIFEMAKLALAVESQSMKVVKFYQLFTKSSSNISFDSTRKKPLSLHLKWNSLLYKQTKKYLREEENLQLRKKKEKRKEKKWMLLYSQVCLNYKPDGDQAEKGIQYIFVFLFPMQPKLQNLFHKFTLPYFWPHFYADMYPWDFATLSHGPLHLPHGHHLHPPHQLQQPEGTGAGSGQNQGFFDLCNSFQIFLDCSKIIYRSSGISSNKYPYCWLGRSTVGQ